MRFLVLSTINDKISRKSVCFMFANFIDEFDCLEAWSPIFTGFDGKLNAQVPGFWFAIGIPQCSQKQMWPIYYYPGVK